MIPYKSIYQESTSQSQIAFIYKKAINDFAIRKDYLPKEEIEIREIVLNNMGKIVKNIDTLIPDNFGRGIKNQLFSHTVSDSKYSLIETSGTLNKGWVYPQSIVKELLCHTQLQTIINDLNASEFKVINPFLLNNFFFQSENVLEHDRVTICNIKYNYLKDSKSINGTQIVFPIPLTELRVIKYNPSNNKVELIKP
jgi:hypothetical protein